MKKNYFLLLLSLLFTCSFLAQNLGDASLKEKFNQLKNIDQDSAFFYAKKLQKSKDICSVMDGLSCESYIFHRKKDYDKAKIIAEKLYRISDSLLSYSPKKENCFYNGKIAALNRIFWINKNTENFKEAYNILTEFETVLNNHPKKESRKNKLTTLAFLTAKAGIKNDLKLEKEALEVLRIASTEIKSPIYKDINTTNSYLEYKANILNSFGNTFLTLSNKENNPTYVDSAAYYYKKAYNVTKLFTPLHLDSDIIYSFRNTEILIAKRKFKEAINLINNYKNISNGYPYKHREVFQKAICFNNLQETDSAIYYSHKLLNDKKEKCKRSNLITMYDILSQQYKKINKIDSAYKYSQKTMHQFSLADRNKEETFQLLYKNDFNKAQELNKELAKKNESISTVFTNILLVSLASFSIFFLFIYNKQKKLKKQLKTVNKTEESAKKEYNIDKELETCILEEIKTIDNNLLFLKSDFSISYLAEKLNTNSTYISFVFNNNKGETFKQYYTRLKIEYIKEKIASEKKYRNYTIKALAEEIGYSNASAFSRAFKKQTGVTPSEFIKSIIP